jgi:hypothetical protein
MTSGGYILSSVIGGMVAGGIGAAASQNSDNPILKGALVAGLIDGALTAVLIAVSSVPAPTLGTSGVGALRSEWQL